MKHALIIGAGIAGPATAMALHRAGISASVFEAHASTAEHVGGFLTVAVNGQHALHALDLDHCLEAGFATPAMAMYSGTGKRLAAFPYGPRLANGIVARTVTRADLYAALRREALERGVEIVHGKRLAEVSTDSSGVTARFADGTTAHGDLLIGADGLRSRTRSLIDPDAPPARYTGLLNTGGYAPAVELDAVPGELNFVFGRRAFFGYVVHPGGDVWWFANLPEATEPTAAQLAAIDARQRLNELFARDRSPALRIVAHTADIITPYGTYDFPAVPTWHRDNMIIIGDAAHAASPSAGQGASMALEDSVVLAQCLRDQPTPAAAFTAFEQSRRERVERVVAWGKKTGDGKAPGVIGRLLRDYIIFPLFVGRGAGKGKEDPLAWIYAFPSQWDTAL